MKQAGTLEREYVNPSPHWKRVLAIVIGIIAMFVGLGLVALIIMAGLEAL